MLAAYVPAYLCHQLPSQRRRRLLTTADTRALQFGNRQDLCKLCGGRYKSLPPPNIFLSIVIGGYILKIILSLTSSKSIVSRNRPSCHSYYPLITLHVLLENNSVILFQIFFLIVLSKFLIPFLR